MTRRGWTREELLIALKIYCELEFGQFHSHHPRIIEVSQALDRTPGSLAMKLCNFASLDPAMKGKGLKGASKADREVMSTFLSEPEKIIYESELAYADLWKDKRYDGFHEPQSLFDFDYQMTRDTESTATVKTRTYQNFFRKTVISSYKFNCAVCSINVPELLIASHIIPWAQDKNLRLLPTNGIALCASHDKAFDRGLFTLKDNYSILLSSEIEERQDNEYVDLLFMKFSERRLNMPFRFMPDKACVAWHRDNIFRH